MTAVDRAVAGTRRGRPRSTSARTLELVALRLFTERGFHETTVDQIAAGAGVSRRTFFRYFDAKSNVLWNEFDHEVETIRAILAEMPDDLTVMDAVRRAVIAANHYRAEDVPELRIRMHLISTVPELAASATVHYDAWERAIAAFVARRSGQPADSLHPLAVGRATLAACRAAYERWTACADADLTVYLDAALRALATGFHDDVLGAEPRIKRNQPRSRPARDAATGPSSPSRELPDDAEALPPSLDTKSSEVETGMNVTVTDVRERKRYEARAGDELAAVAEYVPTDEFLAFTHTEVFDGFEGQGIASTLVRGALDDVRAQRRAVLPVCPFVTSYIRRHKDEYADLLYRSRTGTVSD